MLLNGGELDGVRLLSPKTVALMTLSHTRDLPAVGPGWEFGLGFGIVTDVGATAEAGLTRQLFLGRPLRHVVLGGPEGTAHRRADDAAVPGRTT